MIRRRELLASLAAVGTAGCISSVSGEGGVTLGGVLLSNTTDRPLDVEVRISRDGERVHSTTHEVDPADGRVASVRELDCEWSPGRARYTVEARREDTDWYATELDDAETPCRSLDVRAWDREMHPDVELVDRPCELLADEYGCGFAGR